MISRFRGCSERRILWKVIPRFVPGESGAVGLGVVEEVLSNGLYRSLRQQLRLDSSSVVLVFDTEGELEDES